MKRFYILLLSEVYARFMVYVFFSFIITKISHQVNNDECMFVSIILIETNKHS